MVTRIVSGFVMAAVAIGILLYAPTSALLVALAGMMMVSFFEYSVLMDIPRRLSFGLSLGVVFAVVGAVIGGRYPLALSLLLMGIISLWSIQLRCHGQFTQSVAVLERLTLGILYLLMLAISLSLLIVKGERGFIFFLLAVTHGSDTAAYFSGKYLGKHLFAPHISPKKTWEGFAGGLVGSVIAGAICTALFGLGFSPWQVVVMSVLVGASAALGDLAESMLKRSCNKKDSGDLIPGHGGVLDRVDGLFFSAPVFYALLLLLERISF